MKCIILLFFLSVLNLNVAALREERSMKKEVHVLREKPIGLGQNPIGLGRRDYRDRLYPTLGSPSGMRGPGDAVFMKKVDVKKQ
ncbi:unnamed protein product [Cylicostephanus goldi]|uniref:Uncharacterized protein n=1 Tax=Cylicostephanus goldi TaxID=71465 RepID=A0A3P6SBF3_CYLGO|nr:unnamed protein product [Cylicostephanus goldi]